jgi:Bacterial PH domain
MVETFPMVPATGRAYALSIPIALVALIVVGLAVYLSWSPRHVQFEVSPGKLRIRGDIYGRTIPLADLELANARIVDLGQEPEFRPARRTNGTGLPGYSAGWFKLAGGAKALLFLTERSHVTVIPNSRGWLLLLSVADGPRFLDALRNAAR